MNILNRKYALLTFLTILLILPSFSGCKKQRDPEELSAQDAAKLIQETQEVVTDILDTTAETIQEIDATVKEEEETNEISFAAMLPDPTDIFTNGTITISDEDGGEYYIFEVTDYQEEEFGEFVQALKDMGWTDSKFDIKDAYGAYSADGKYWVEAGVGLNQGVDTIYVVCNVRQSEKE